MTTTLLLPKTTTLFVTKDNNIFCYQWQPHFFYQWQSILNPVQKVTSSAPCDSTAYRNVYMHPAKVNLIAWCTRIKNLHWRNKQHWEEWTDVECLWNGSTTANYNKKLYNKRDYYLSQPIHVSITEQKLVQIF